MESRLSIFNIFNKSFGTLFIKCNKLLYFVAVCCSACCSNFGLKQRKINNCNKCNKIFRHFRKSVKISSQKNVQKKIFLKACCIVALTAFWLCLGKNQCNNTATKCNRLHFPHGTALYHRHDTSFLKASPLSSKFRNIV